MIGLLNLRMTEIVRQNKTTNRKRKGREQFARTFVIFYQVEFRNY